MPVSTIHSISSVTMDALAGADALKQVAIRNESDALTPWPVARREMCVHVVVGAEIGTHGAEQLSRFTVSGSENARPVNTDWSCRIYSAH